ncbi:MAG: hypothetical protein IT435_16380 [Phycisphaerales bacterium]|nr:hypothetical protein [Phycisphaerales bacterium]
MRTLATLVLAILCAVILPGCNEPEPKYRADLLAFDAELVGTWRHESTDRVVVDGKPQREVIDLKLEARRLNINGGRIEPELLDEAKRPKSGPFNAYTGTLVLPASETASETIEFKGFLIEVNGIKFLVFQPSTKQMGIGHLGGVVLPIHQAIKISRNGDELTFRGPRTRIAWLPDVQWLDAPPEPLPEEPELKTDAPGIHITGDIDRFVAALKKYGPREDFWEKPTVMKKIK